MTRMNNFVSDHQHFAAYKLQVEGCFQTEASLPTKVFRDEFSRFRFEEFDWAMSSEFWPAMQALCRSSGDTTLLLAVLDPDPLNYYVKEFGYFNWAKLPISASSEEYWELLNQHPEQSPADSLLVNSEKIIWLPPSGEWAIWGERSFEVCVLGCREPNQGDSWHDVDWALETAIPNAFRNKVVPLDFAEKLRRNYGAST